MIYRDTMGGRWSRERTLSLCACLVVSCVSSSNCHGPDRAFVQPSSRHTVAGYEITVTPLGPDQDALDALANELPNRPEILAKANQKPPRLLTLRLTDGPEASGDAAPGRFEAELYDYAAEKTLVADGSLTDPHDLTVDYGNFQPPPTREEFAEAVSAAKAGTSQLSQGLAAGKLIPYPAMPGIDEADPNGGVTGPRTVTIGVMSEPSTGRLMTPRQLREFEITGEQGEPAATVETSAFLGVRLATKEVTEISRAPQLTPQTSPLSSIFRGVQVEPDRYAICERALSPNAHQPTTHKGTPGRAIVSIAKDGVELWRLVVVRPSQSSGTRGSGVELRDVSFKGTRILKRANVPILNVRYDSGACGPYRDWQYQESEFEASGFEAAPGLLLSDTPARTFTETTDDHGDFRGVDLFVDRPTGDIILVSEMEASWYRYISKWRLGKDGTIQPEFGFAGTANGCTCRSHKHHVYWRLEFDVGGLARNRLLESAPQASDWHPIHQEETRDRTFPGMRWMVRDTDSKHAVRVEPGSDDGVADDYSVHDLWFLHARDSEMDDHHHWTRFFTKTDLDDFANGETLDDGGVVVWYSAEFYHQTGIPYGYRGPRLVPQGW